MSDYTAITAHSHTPTHRPDKWKRSGRFTLSLSFEHSRDLGEKNARHFYAKRFNPLKAFTANCRETTTSMHQPVHVHAVLGDGTESEDSSFGREMGGG